MNELAGRNLGGYQLEEEIGRGSMGLVYRGKHIARGHEAAIKVLPQTSVNDSSYGARFVREAQIMAGLNHPNIVQIYDAGQQNGLLYFAMEYVQGPTLANVLHQNSMLPQHIAIEYAAQIADALDLAYRDHHVIHRDIKPENLMIDRSGKMKIMDFGLAKATGHPKITIAKTLVGSIYYASPEQLWGQPLDNRSDIYALGVVLYEMASGQRPFTSRSLPELSQAIIGGSFHPPHTINTKLTPELEHIICKAMARDREKRYETAMLMAQELRALSTPRGHTQAKQELSPVTAHASQKMTHEKINISPLKRPQIQHLSDFHTQATPPPLTPKTNAPLPTPTAHNKHIPPHSSLPSIKPSSDIQTPHTEGTFRQPGKQTVQERPGAIMSGQKKSSPRTRLSFWQWLQGIFKSS